MSFMSTLAKMAVGFAAAKGLEQYQKMGGMQGLQSMFANANAPGGLADNLGRMAQQMGFPGGSQMMHNIMSQMGQTASATTGATQAGLGGLFASLTGGAAAGSGMMAEMMGTLTQGTPASDMAEQNAKLMIRSMIQAAKADGEIDKEEQAKILEHLKNASPEEIAFVKEQLAAPLDVTGLVADTQAAMKSQVYSSALMAITVDTPGEKAFLTQLATALGLDSDTRDALHAAQGRAPLGA